jgi:hypothetical protein
LNETPELFGAKRERELFIDNQLVRIHFVSVMIRWTGLAPWRFEFPFSGSPPSTFLLARCSYRGGLVFKARRLVYHSTLGLRVTKKKRRDK